VLFGLPCWANCLARAPLFVFQKLELALAVTRVANGGWSSFLRLFAKRGHSMLGPSSFFHS
jgi:hypothetical protein